MTSKHFSSSNPSRRWQARRKKSHPSITESVSHKNSWLQKTEDVIGFLLKAATLFLIGVLLFWLFRSVQKEGYTIEPFSVPKHLAESGYDGATIARKLQDEVQKLKEEASSIKADSVKLSREDTPDLNVSVLSVGFSLNSLTYHLRDLLGRKNNYIRGEITQLDSIYTITVRMTGQVPIERQITIEENQQKAIQTLLRVGGEVVLENTDPYRLAVVCYQNRRYRDAMNAIHRVIEEHPNEAQWGYLAWGSVLQRQDNLSGAVRKYEEAIRLQPDFLLPYVRLAWLQKQRGNLIIAKQSMRKVVKLAQNDAQQLRNIVWFFNSEEEYATADSIFQRVIELDPKNPNNYVQWASSQFERGQNEAAIKTMTKAEPYIGNQVEGIMLKAFSRLIVGDTLGAFENVQAAFDLNPSHSAAAAHTMNGFYLMGDYEGVVGVAQRADWDNMHEDKFQKQSAINTLANAHNKMGSYHQARQACLRNIAIDSYYSVAYITYAESHAYEDQLDSCYHYLALGLERGYETKWLDLKQPPLDRLANQPRLQALLEKYRKERPVKG